MDKSIVSPFFDSRCILGAQVRKKQPFWRRFEVIQGLTVYLVIGHNRRKNRAVRAVALVHAVGRRHVLMTFGRLTNAKVARSHGKDVERFENDDT